MDPLTIAVAGTLVGGCLLRGLEGYLKKDKVSGSIAVSAGEDYSRRWEDPEYVKMIHQTRKLEIETLGHTDTLCECQDCRWAKTPTPKPAPPKGPAGVSERPRRRIAVVGGWVYELTSDIPDGAKGEPYQSTNVENFSGASQQLYFAVFTWYDTTTGKEWRKILTASRKAREDEKIKLDNDIRHYRDEYTKYRTYEEYLMNQIKKQNSVPAPIIISGKRYK